MAESSLEDTLTKGKIAGMPVWALGAGLAGTFVAVAWWRNRQGSSVPPTQDFPAPEAAPEEDTAGWGLPPGPIGDWLAQNPTAASYPVGWSPRGLPSPISNAQWARLVSDELFARGDDPALVTTAIYKYLAGNTLNPQEQAVINLALKMIGLPPEGIIPVNTTPPPGGGGGTPNVEPKYFHVWEGAKYDNIIALAKAANPGLDLSETKLAQLNPGWPDKYLTWSKVGVGWVAPGTPGAERTFGSSFDLRIR